MKELTHLSVGAACGVVATGFDSSPATLGWVCLLVGSVLPDLDHKRSFIGKYAPWVSAPLERKYGHRTITHSLLGVVLLGVLAMPLFVYDSSAYSWLIIGYLSHIFLDAFNVQGVPLFYPFSRLEFVSFHNRAWRIPYGSPAEMTLLAVVLLSTLALVPLARGGFMPAFHRMVGSPGAAVEDFQRWRDSYEVFLTLDGDAPLRREMQHQEKLRVLDCLAPQLLLVEDASGRAFRVAAGKDAGEAELWAVRCIAEQAEPITVRKWSLQVDNRTLQDVLDALPASGRVHLNADLEIASELNTPPITGEFLRMQASGSTLALRSARREDLERARNVVVSSGLLYIRAEYAVGEQAQGLRTQGDRFAKRAHTVLLEELPSVQACLVAVGDEVTEGQALVSGASDGEAEAARKAEEDAAAKLQLGAEQLQHYESDSAENLEALRTRIKAKKKRVEELAWLVERRAKPRVTLTDAEAELATLRESEAQALRNLSARRLEWRRQRIDLQAIQRKARADLKKIQGAEFLRSPVNGRVTALRVVNVSTEGVNVEVDLLERVE